MMKAWRYRTGLLGWLVLAIGLASTVKAQPFVRVITPFPVVGADETPLTHPFLGGFNIPRPQFADIDADGDLDLFVQERAGALIYFENTGTPAAPVYTWRTDAYQDLAVGEWARLVDADADGDLDLFAEQPFSLVRYYRNTGSGSGTGTGSGSGTGTGSPQQPAFTLAEDTLRTTAGALVFVDRQNVPAIADLDCDGLVDFFAPSTAGTLTRYVGQGVEGGVPRFALDSNRFADIEIIGPGGAAGPTETDKTLHGAAAVALRDVTGDGLPDLVWGDYFSPSLYLLTHTGTCAAPAFERTTDAFPSAAPVQTSGYNVPAFGDVDADGDLDLAVGVLGGSFGAVRDAVDNLYFYEQTPAGYVLQTRQLLGQVDVGTESSPAVADLDGDADLDVLVGNAIDPAAPQRSTLTLFENTGTAPAPAWRLAERDAVPLGTGVFNAAPALGDLDGDGDPDLVVGDFNGSLAFFRNASDGDGIRFELVDARIASLRDTPSSGSFAAPALADLDADGDLDLVVGEDAGTLNLFENTGTPSAPQFTFVTERYAEVRAGNRSSPAFADLDADGDLDLVVGTRRHGLAVYRNAGLPTAARFTLDGDLEIASLSADVLAPVFADLTGDGAHDLLVGTQGGGLLFLANDAVGSEVEDVRAMRGQLVVADVYPNPFDVAATVELGVARTGPVQVAVFDVLGRRVAVLHDGVLPTGRHRMVVDGAAWASGIYLLVASLPDGARATRMLVKR